MSVKLVNYLIIYYKITHFLHFKKKKKIKENHPIRSATVASDRLK